MILENETVLLRPITESDTNKIIFWRNKDNVRCNFLQQDLFTVEGHTNWLKNMVWTGRVKQFIIVDKSTNMDVGSVYLRDIDMSHKKAEYGIFIGEDSARGKGIGTKAAQLILNYAFEELMLNKVFLRVLADNLGAIKSYQKAGFEQEGYFREEVLLNGVFRDIIFMAQFNRQRKQ